MTPAEQLAKALAENAALHAQFATMKAQIDNMNKPRALRYKIGEKGGVQINGLGRFPLTLYVEQMERVLDAAAEIRAFINANRSALKTKNGFVSAVAA